MNTVKSISAPERIFETSGSQPLLVLCDDLNFYVCKYNRWPGSSAIKLLHEVLGGSFAKAWNLAVPEFCLVNIEASHIEDMPGLQPAFFNAECFGSHYNNKYVEVDNFYAEMSKSDKSRFSNREDFLKIALFDIWMANEDRNFMNYNLLIDVENENRFIPIDHDAIFNTGNLDKGLDLLTEEDSIISTNFTLKLFSRKELQNKEYLNEIQDEYYLCTANCEKQIDTILNEIPLNWRINTKDYATLLKENLFKQQWIDASWKHFLELIQLHLQK